MRAWLFQDYRQKSKHGDKAPWSVGWIDPEGNRKSKRIGSRSMAEKFRRKVEGQLAAGTYEAHTSKSWEAFRTEYEEKVASQTSAGNRLSIKIALDHFERIIKPKMVRAIKTITIYDYVAKRRLERGIKKGDTVSPATINKELRHVRAALRVAHECKYLAEVPKIKMLREPEKLPTYISSEDFAAIYGACDSAKRPKAEEYSSGEWWRALITFAYMTGWRISELLAVRWDDVSLDKGTAITRHDDNKGRRDEVVPLHPVVIEHLRRLADASIRTDPGARLVFYWPGSERGLWDEFCAIQQAAGIHLDCHENHEHTDACHVYGFHDLRRGFATYNATEMSADALQKLMRHKDYTTTKRYINMAGQLNQAVANLHVPEVLRNRN